MEQPGLIDSIRRVVVSRRQILIIIVCMIVVMITIPFIPSGLDWSTSLRPATLKFVSLENPYDIPGVFNPPWLFILLAPFAILPDHIGGALLLWLNLATWFLIANKFGKGNLAIIIAVLTFPVVINGYVARNVDFLVMWGLLLRPEFAVFFLMMKPQVGGVAILFLALQAYRKGGFKRLLQIFIAPTVFIALSLLLYGLWPLQTVETIDLPWNTSPIKILGWPSILIGLVIFVLALRHKDPEDGMNSSMAASPFFSPYVGTQSWVAILPAIIKTKALYVLWILLWAWIAYRMYR